MDMFCENMGWLGENMYDMKYEVEGVRPRNL